jgi:hypothetical protein
MNAHDVKFVRNILLLFASIGVILLGVAVIAYTKKRDYLSTAVQVPGVVVGLEKAHDVFHPVFSYVTEDERPLKFTGGIGSNPPAWRVGEAVQVYYDPAFPEDAEVQGFFTQWLGVLVTGGLGLALVIPLGVGLIWRLAHP